MLRVLRAPLTLRGLALADGEITERGGCSGFGGLCLQADVTQGH